MPFSFQAQNRHLREEPTHDLFVLFRLKAARAVNKDAARFQQGDYCSCNDELLLRHSSKIIGAHSPSHIDQASHHSGIGAWCTHEDTIEWRGGSNFFWETIPRPILANGVSNSRAKPVNVILQNSQPLGIAIACRNECSVFDLLRDKCGLPARRCARIEDSFSGFWI